MYDLFIHRFNVLDSIYLMWIPNLNKPEHQHQTYLSYYIGPDLLIDLLIMYILNFQCLEFSIFNTA